MEPLETVKIGQDSVRGWVIINKSDFDPIKHVLYGVEKTESPDKRRGRPKAEG